MQDSTSPQKNPRSSSLDLPAQQPIGPHSFSPVFTVTARTPLLLLGAFSMAAMGCSFGSSTRDADGSVPTMSPDDSTQALLEQADRGSEVEFNDTPDAAGNPGASTEGAPLGANASGGLVDALAATYAADMAALAEMQRSQREAAAMVVARDARAVPAVRAQPVAPTPADESQASNAPSNQAPKALVRTPAVTPTKKPAPASDGGTPPPPVAPAPAPTPEAPTSEPGEEPTGGSTDGSMDGGHGTHETDGTHEHLAEGDSPVTDDPAGDETVAPGSATVEANPGTVAAATAAVPASPLVARANGALELPPPPTPAPTAPGELAKLLAESLAKQGEQSSQPMREWLAFAAVAVANPDLKLPEDFGADLLPSERERVLKAHAAFAAFGTALRDGQSEIDRSVSESLIAALTGGPKLGIPKVDLCTRVEGFGRYTPLSNHKFLARANTRFIVYTELDGFNSEYTDANYVTRLATRISIESERDNIEVWQRSPEWTAVVDTSDVRRDEFFLCEIIPISEYLSVGSYRLKIEVRDEATGAIAVSTLPIQIVADPAMAAASE